MGDLASKSSGELLAEYVRVKALIYGPENDGRLSPGSSDSLDWWHDTCAEVEATLVCRDARFKPHLVTIDNAVKRAMDECGSPAPNSAWL